MPAPRAQAAAKLYSQVMRRGVEEQTALRHRAGAREPAVSSPDRHWPVEVQDHQMGARRSEVRPVGQLGLRGDVDPVPAQAGARPGG
jgi:hypothetical protein